MEKRYQGRGTLRQELVRQSDKGNKLLSLGEDCGIGKILLNVKGNVQGKYLMCIETY